MVEAHQRKHLARQPLGHLLLNDLMDRRTLENWQKVKEALEKAGKTDSMFYKRAVSILSGKPDPLK